jgi:hypothetical protein
MDASLDRDRVKAAKVIQDLYRSRLARPFVYRKGQDYPESYYARQAPLSSFERIGGRSAAGAMPFQKVYGLPDEEERVVRFEPDRDEHRRELETLKRKTEAYLSTDEGREASLAEFRSTAFETSNLFEC